MTAAQRDGRAECVPHLAKDKLLRAWVVWRLLVRWHQWSLEPSRATVQPQHLNLLQSPESLAQSCLPWYTAFMFQDRLRQFYESGQELRLIVIDGNCKLARRICGRDAACLLHCEPLGAFAAVKCPRTPSFKKRWCLYHCRASPVPEGELEQTETIAAHRRSRRKLSASDIEPYDVRLIQRGDEGDPRARGRWVPASWVTTRQLNEYWEKVREAGEANTEKTAHASSSASKDLTATSCLTHKETDSARQSGSRKGGWLVGVSHDGCIIHLQDFAGAESLSQRYFFLANIMQEVPTVESVVHDDACHLRKYADARATSSTFAAKLTSQNIKYVVDWLHFRGHVDPWCREHCDPDAPQNKSAMESVNTSACEQLFSALSRHRFVVSRMRAAIGTVFLNEVAAMRNAAWLESRLSKMQAKGSKE